MWTDGNGYFYYGDCRPGDRAATEQEIVDWNVTNQPTLQQRIDAECQKEGIATEIMLEGLLAGMVGRTGYGSAQALRI